ELARIGGRELGLGEAGALAGKGVGLGVGLAAAQHRAALLAEPEAVAPLEARGAEERELAAVLARERKLGASAVAAPEEARTRGIAVMAREDRGLAGDAVALLHREAAEM